MATTIKLKNSVTTTNAPSSLVQGEVAINITDKKVWVGNAATTPIQLLGTGADGTFTNISVSSVATFGAGTVSAPSITTTGDTNTGIFFPAADTIAFTEGGVESMRIDSAGNVGIGTTSPVSSGGYTALTLNNATNSGYVVLQTNGTTTSDWYVSGGTTATFRGVNVPLALTATGANFISASTNGTERMRIDSSGNVGIGTSSPSQKLEVTTTTRPQLKVSYNGTSGIFLTDATTSAYKSWQISSSDITANTLQFTPSTANNGTTFTTPAVTFTSAGNVIIATGTLEFTNPNGVTTPTANGQGSIGTYSVYGTTITGQGSAYDISFFNKNQGVAGYVATGATTITTSSDERLKENLVPITNALATVNNLRTVTGNYKADPSRNVAFFVAQDMKEHFPQAFEDANPDAFGVNYNWTIPLLAAAIKELKAELDSVKAELQTLKGN